MEEKAGAAGSCLVTIFEGLFSEASGEMEGLIGGFLR